jgi:hypothetical protein
MIVDGQCAKEEEALIRIAQTIVSEVPERHRVSINSLQHSIECKSGDWYEAAGSVRCSNGSALCVGI